MQIPKHARHCIEWVIDNLEVGWNPNDPSMYGITLRKLREYVVFSDLDIFCNGDFEDGNQEYLKDWLEELSKEDAIKIYYTCYWLPLGLNFLESEKLAFVIFAMIINREKFVEQWQEAIRANVDGIVGPDTIYLSNKAYDQHFTIEDFLKRCQSVYETIGGENLQGWKNRIEKVRKEVGL